MNKSILILLVALSLVVCSLGLACGGNCPTSDCNACPCGKTKKAISIEEYCKKYAGWDQQCCYCVVSRTSSGNKNYIKPFDSHYAIGMLPLFYDNLKKEDLCNLTTESDLCDEYKNSECAGKTFMKYKWDGPEGIWKNAAGACGCDKALFQE